MTTQDKAKKTHRPTIKRLRRAGTEQSHNAPITFIKSESSNLALLPLLSIKKTSISTFTMQIQDVLSLSGSGSESSLDTSSRSFRLRRKLGGSIRSTKRTNRQLRSYSDDDAIVLRAWSRLPDLFESWDLDQSGTIDRTELLCCMKAFCKRYRIDYSVKAGEQILEYVANKHSKKNNDNDNDNGGCEVRLGGFTEFLIVFAKSVKVAPFDVAYFLEDFLEERADRRLYHERTVIVRDLPDLESLTGTDGSTSSARASLIKTLDRIMAGLDDEAEWNDEDNDEIDV